MIKMIKVDENIHKELKVMAAKAGITLKDMVAKLVKDSKYGK